MHDLVKGAHRKGVLLYCIFQRRTIFRRSHPGHTAARRDRRGHGNQAAGKTVRHAVFLERHGGGRRMKSDDESEFLLAHNLQDAPARGNVLVVTYLIE